MTTAAAIELACQMALGDDTSHDRFRFAWDAAQTELGTLSGFAKQLGVHPSSLTRTNFKLSPVRRQVAAELLGVSAGFLAAGVVTQENLPAVLHAWPTGKPAIVYCDSLACEASEDVAKRLREFGVAPVFVLKGGWQAWLAATK